MIKMESEWELSVCVREGELVPSGVVRKPQ